MNCKLIKVNKVYKVIKLQDIPYLLIPYLLSFLAVFFAAVFFTAVAF
jgi:hypothetical protein